MLSVSRKSVRFVEPDEGSAGRNNNQQDAARRREADRKPRTPTTTTTTPPSPASVLRTRPVTTSSSSSQGRTTLGALSDSTALGLEGDAASAVKPESAGLLLLRSHSSSSAVTSAFRPQPSPGADKPPEQHLLTGQRAQTPFQRDPAGNEKSEEEEPPAAGDFADPGDRGVVRFETKNYLTRQGIVFKPKNPFNRKLITVYALSAAPWEKTTTAITTAAASNEKRKSAEASSKRIERIVRVETTDLAAEGTKKPGSTNAAFLVLNSSGDQKQQEGKPAPEILYVKLEPAGGCQSRIVPVKSAEVSGSSSRSQRQRSASRNNGCANCIPSSAAPTFASAATTRPVDARLVSSSLPPSSATATTAKTLQHDSLASPATNKYCTPANNNNSLPQATSASRTASTTGTMSRNLLTSDLNKLSGFTTTGMEIYGPVTTVTLSRTQEKEELQQLNDRFAAYIQRVRMLAEKNNQMDSSALMASSKSLEIEIHNLKNMYEQELEKLRKELEACNHERTTYSMQVNKQVQCCSELQDRLKVEMDKSAKLQDEANAYQRRIGGLEAEIQDLRIAATRPQADLEQLQRKVENMTREGEAWRHRYEHEEVARLEGEDKIQQLMKKIEFNDKIAAERVAEMLSRIETSSATILSLESKVRDLSKTDVSVSELLKQVRDTAEAELRKYQIESDEQYNRNLTALKAQLDNDAKAVGRLEAERTQLRGSVGELQARIRSLEGQVANLDHQKQTLEDAISVERARAADSAHALERKLREVQDMLVVKMREVTTAREQNIPLKAEIEVLKVLLEEEEKRLRVPLAVTSSIGAVTTSAAAAPASAAMPAYDISTTSHTTATGFNPAASSYSITASKPAAGVSGFGSSTNVGGHTVNFASGANSYPAPIYFPFYSATEGLPYAPSPPLSLTHIPDALQTPTMSAAANCGGGGAYESHFSMMPQPQYEEDLDPQLYGYTSSMPYAKYTYETTPGLNRLAVEASPPNTPRAVGPVRAKSAPANRERDLNLVASNTGQGHDYFDKMFHDLQRESLYSNDRPKSTPLKGTGRPLSSLYHDYTVSTSSATGDLKIFEVHQEGKYVRIINDGVTEIEFGGYMLQQNVGGHPVAVFRFPPRTKFAPNSTITVLAGCNDHKLHNPPQEFVWKEQQKWGTGPECTTILCRPNGQAVAWTTAAHRFSRDAFQDTQSEADENTARADEERQDDIADDDSLTEINVNVSEAKPTPVYLRREKQQPPSLQANKHPHGNTPSTPVHPNVNQPRPYRYGNDNSSNNRQSRSQSTRPDPVAGQPYAGAAAQKLGSAPLRKYVSGVSSQQSGGRTNGKSGEQEGVPGEACDVPSPFMKPHARFQSGLDQVQSQHHHEFLPPMPRPPTQSAAW